MKQKKKEEEKQYEVIVSPTDVLGKELEEVLGGDGCTCHAGGTFNYCDKEDKPQPSCGPNAVWIEVLRRCECLPGYDGNPHDLYVGCRPK